MVVQVSKNQNWLKLKYFNFLNHHYYYYYYYIIFLAQKPTIWTIEVPFIFWLLWLEFVKILPNQYERRLDYFDQHFQRWWKAITLIWILFGHVWVFRESKLPASRFWELLAPVEKDDREFLWFSKRHIPDKTESFPRIFFSLFALSKFSDESETRESYVELLFSHQNAKLL